MIMIENDDEGMSYDKAIANMAALLLERKVAKSQAEAETLADELGASFDLSGLIDTICVLASADDDDDDEEDDEEINIKVHFAPPNN